MVTLTEAPVLERPSSTCPQSLKAINQFRSCLMANLHPHPVTIIQSLLKLCVQINGIQIGS